MSTRITQRNAFDSLAIARLAVLVGAVVFFVHDQTSGEVPATIKVRDAATSLTADKSETPNQVIAKQLSHVLDTTQPPLQEVVEIAGRDGLDAAVARIREMHQQAPERPVFPHGLAPADPDKIITIADGVIQGGWRFGKREPYPVAIPIDWAANPYNDRGWRMWLNAWRVLEPILAAYDESGDKRYLKFANGIALDWIDQHIVAENDNAFTWYDMAIGRRAVLLGKLIDANLRTDVLSNERLLLLFTAARRHAVELHGEDKIAWHSNHGIYQLVGLLSLGMSTPELSGVQDFKPFAKQGLCKLISQHFSDEGIHLEHSPFYHVALINTLGLLIERGLIDDDETLKLFQLARRNIAWMCHPHGDLIRAGDGDQTQAATRIMYADDPQLQYVLSEGKSGTQPPTNYQIFKESGYAVFRGSWEHWPWREAPYLFFSAAFHSRTHKHADDFTFEWSEQGRSLLIDSGRYSYKYDHPHRQYVESTRAHNTVEIDGRNFSRYKNDAFGSAIVTGGESDGAYFVTAEVNRTRFFNTHHKRTLVFHPGRWLVVIDHLTSPESHDFAQCFHFGPELMFHHTSTGGVAARLPNSKTVLNVLSLSPSDAVTATLIRGQTEPRMQGWTSLAANRMTPNYALELRTSGNDVRYVTVLALTGPQENLQPLPVLEDQNPHNLQVRWQANGASQGFDLHEDESGLSLKLLSPPAVTAEKPGSAIR